MAYKGVFMLEDDEMFQVFTKCRELGGIAMVHAENGSIIKELEKDGTIYEKQTSFPFLGEYCFGADITSISTTTTTTISKELVLKLNHLCRYWFRYTDKCNYTNLLRW